tara:strand:- start:804 stop:1085 length:282 start_codon:yes stop_codon:yes gene_type:complete
MLLIRRTPRMPNSLERFKSITKKDLEKLSSKKLQDIIDDLLFLELFSKTPKLDINAFVIEKITEVRDILESRGIFLNKRRERNFKKAQQRRKN